MSKWRVDTTFSAMGDKHVEADRCAIHEGGTLVFFNNKDPKLGLPELIRAFAHNAWVEVNLVEE